LRRFIAAIENQGGLEPPFSLRLVNILKTHRICSVFSLVLKNAASHGLPLDSPAAPSKWAK
jgi:hypothetical protein